MNDADYERLKPCPRAENWHDYARRVFALAMLSGEHVEDVVALAAEACCRFGAETANRLHEEVRRGEERAEAEAVRAATAAEREACARTAESNCGTWEEEGDGESVLASQSFYGMAQAGREIAAAIRRRADA